MPSASHLDMKPSMLWLNWLALLFVLLNGCAAETSLPLAASNPGQTSDETSECVDDLSVAEDLQLKPVSNEIALGKIWKSHSSIQRAGVVFLSGVDGGFFEPVDGLYERVAAQLSHVGVSSIFVRYRNPGELESSVQDAVAAADYLKRLGVRRVALVGWSFGGAVIMNAAVRVPEVETVVGIAAQSRDTEAVQKFKKQSILLFHSDQDENVPYYAVQQILDEAPAGVDKRRVNLQGFDHSLSGARNSVDPVVLGWLESKLGLPKRQREV